MKLSEKIQYLRQKKGLSQKELSEMLNVSIQLLLSWEQGIAQPGIAQIVLFAEIFNVTTDQLLRDDAEVLTQKTVFKDQEKIEQSAKMSEPVMEAKYIYVGVRFDTSTKIYYYISDDPNVSVGDRAIVSTQTEGNKTVSIISVGEYSANNAPYPKEHTKKLLKVLKNGRTENSSYGMQTKVNTISNISVEKDYVEDDRLLECGKKTIRPPKERVVFKNRMLLIISILVIGIMAIAIGHDLHIMRSMKDAIIILDTTPTNSTNDQTLKDAVNLVAEKSYDLSDHTTPIKKVVILKKNAENILSALYEKCLQGYKEKDYYSDEELLKLFNKLNFLAFYNYENSDDLSILCSLYINTRIDQRVKYFPNYEDLYSLFDYLDAKEYVFQDESYFVEFMKGRWTTGDNSYYFEINEADSGASCTYNLPRNSYGDHFEFSDGIYYCGTGSYNYDELLDTEFFQFNNKEQEFKFSIIDRDSVSVYCYGNDTAYTLFRNK